MIEAIIVKNGQSYQFNYPNSYNIQTLHEQLMEIATGKADYVSEDKIVDLGTSPDYECITIARHEDPNSDLVAPPEAHLEEEEGEDYIRGFYDKFTYMGNVVEVKGIRAKVSEVGIVLIYAINGMGPSTSFGPTNLYELTFRAGKIQGFGDPVVLTPKGDLAGEEEAFEYMKDYIKHIRGHSEQSRDHLDAVAFRSINENLQGEMDQ